MITPAAMKLLVRTMRKLGVMSVSDGSVTVTLGPTPEIRRRRARGAKPGTFAETENPADALAFAHTEGFDDNV